MGIGDNPKRATALWEAAATRQLGRSAYIEGIAHLENALEMLKRLGDERTEHALRLRTLRADALLSSKGSTGPEAIGAYTAARELARELGEPPEIFPILRGIINVHVHSAEFQSALDTANEYLRLARSQADLKYVALGHGYLGQSKWMMGDLVEARKHLEAELEGYDAQHQLDLPLALKGDAKAAALNYLGPTLSLLGFPIQGLQAARAAVAHVENRTANAYSLTLATGMLALTLRIQRGRVAHGMY